MKKWFIFLVLLLILPLVTALDYQTHKQDTTLEFSITSNNATGCNLTSINAPLGNIIIINQTGTRSSQTFNFTIDGGNYSEFGTYCHKLECSDGSTVVSGEKCYEVNYFGKELTSSQSTIYIGLLGILIFTLFVTFFGMGYLPKENATDEYGRIMSINYLKHFRLVLWLFSYFLFVAILYLSSNIAFSFLPAELFAKVIFTLFVIFMSMSPIIVIVLMISFFVEFYHDKEFQGMLNRGIFPGEQL